jgi:hypothetical protein
MDLVQDTQLTEAQLETKTGTPEKTIKQIKGTYGDAMRLGRELTSHFNSTMNQMGICPTRCLC